MDEEKNDPLLANGPVNKPVTNSEHLKSFAKAFFSLFRIYEDPYEDRQPTVVTSFTHNPTVEELPERKSEQKHMRDLSKQSHTGSVVVLLFALYITIGLVFYSSIHHWTLTNTVYFTVNTFLSIGYGDMLIFGIGEYIFTGLFVLIGAGFIGAAVGMSVTSQSDHKQVELERYLKSSEYETAGGEKNFSMIIWEKNYFKRKLAIHIVEIILIVLTGTFVMGYWEDWTYAQAFYWAAVTITTTGYGDLVPSNDAQKWFTTAYSLFGVLMIARALSFVARFPSLWKRAEDEREILGQYKQNRDVLELIGNDDRCQGLGIRKSPKRVERSEFILNMLILLDKVTPHDIKECGHAFDAIDSKKVGYIDDSSFAKKQIDSQPSSPL